MIFAACATFVATVAAACGGPSGPAEQPAGGEVRAALPAEGGLVFTPTHELPELARAKVRHPSDPLDEGQYVSMSIDRARTSLVVFEANGAVVRVYRTVEARDGHRTRVLEGKLRKGGARGARTFDLDRGSLTGGRLVVWTEGETERAELTIYGSGVPIVESQRGTLTPRRRARPD